jgi:hypothetical protein
MSEYPSRQEHETWLRGTGWDGKTPFSVAPRFDTSGHKSREFSQNLARRQSEGDPHWEDPAAFEFYQDGKTFAPRVGFGAQFGIVRRKSRLDLRRPHGPPSR